MAPYTFDATFNVAESLLAACEVLAPCSGTLCVYMLGQATLLRAPATRHCWDNLVVRISSACSTLFHSAIKEVGAVKRTCCCSHSRDRALRNASNASSSCADNAKWGYTHCVQFCNSLASTPRSYHHFVAFCGTGLSLPTWALAGQNTVAVPMSTAQYPAARRAVACRVSASSLWF